MKSDITINKQFTVKCTLNGFYTLSFHTITEREVKIVRWTFMQAKKEVVLSVIITCCLNLIQTVIYIFVFFLQRIRLVNWKFSVYNKIFPIYLLKVVIYWQWLHCHLSYIIIMIYFPVPYNCSLSLNFFVVM